MFTITQHDRDKQLMESLIEYFGCGGSFLRNNTNFGEFMITKFKDLTKKIIPFFDKYQIIGVKALDFADFCKIAELMNNKAHLTLEGLENVRSKR